MNLLILPADQNVKTIRLFQLETIFELFVFHQLRISYTKVVIWKFLQNVSRCSKLEKLKIINGFNLICGIFKSAEFVGTTLSLKEFDVRNP